MTSSSPWGSIPGFPAGLRLDAPALLRQLAESVSALGQLPVSPLAQLEALVQDITARRQQVQALAQQLALFDEQLAVFEQALQPLIAWTRTATELQSVLLDPLGLRRSGEPSSEPD